MSDYELVSGPSSPLSTCSSASRHSCAAGRSTFSDTAAGQCGSGACPTAEPRAQYSCYPPSSKAQASQQQRSMTSIQPKLSMRPISTPVNLLVCGASGSGKSSFIRAFRKMLSHDGTAAAAAGRGLQADGSPASWEVSGTGPSADPAAVLARADEYATTIGPIPVPEAGRELLYKLQDWPGYGATLDPAAYLEALLTYIIQQQQKDYKQLKGSRGMPKSLVCGSLAHSVTACIYFLPPHGPSKLDLVLMSGLSRHVALLPVVGKADAMTADEAEACCQLVRHMLEEPNKYEKSMQSVKPYKLATGELPFLLMTRSNGGDASAAAAAAGATASKGLNQLAGLLTGDEVYGLLDHAWDKYTAYCDGFSAGDYDAAYVAADICAAAKLPSWAALAVTQRKLLVETDRSKHLEYLLAEKQKQLSREQEWACAQLKAAEAAKANEAQLLNDLWTVFSKYKSAIGHSSVALKQYFKESDIPKGLEALKKRLPDLKW